MTKCNNLGLIAKVVNISTPELVRGADCFVTTQVRFKDGDAYNFQSLEGATGYFPSATGVSAVTVVGNAEEAAGTVKFAMDSATSNQLAAGEALDFQVNFRDARGLTIIVLEESLTVRDPEF